MIGGIKSQMANGPVLMAWKEVIIKIYDTIYFVPPRKKISNQTDTIIYSIVANSSTSHFSFDFIKALVNSFFEFLLRLFRKLTANDINQEIFSIEKRKNVVFFIFIVKKPQNSMTIFLRIFLSYYTYL